MARKRAVDKSQTVEINGNLPLFYTSITPVAAERHGDMRLSPTRVFDYATQANAIPITCDEFAQAARSYPIVFAGRDVPTPVALVGLAKNKNDHLNEDGTWVEGAYIPAYLRRYPFMLVKESDTSTRQVLCADMSSPQFTEGAGTGNRLFDEMGKATDALNTVLDFCTKYETSLRRTVEVMKRAKELDLFQPSTVNVSRNEKTARIEGFQMIAEDRVRGLSDKKLADLARSGVLAIFAAHHMSMVNFSDMGAL